MGLRLGGDGESCFQVVADWGFDNRFSALYGAV